MSGYQKCQASAFSTYSPGPDLDDSPAPGDQPTSPLGSFGTEVDPASAAYLPQQTYLSRRITSGMSQAVPVAQFTPDQEFFRRSLADGRWQADYGVGAHAPVYRSIQDPVTGAVDVVRMEPWNDPSSPQYLDLGGKGGVSYGVKRP
jgi:hypothetical protein